MAGVKELIDVEIWSDPDALRFGTMLKGANAIYNYRHRGHSYDLEITAGGMSVKRDGRLLLRTSSDQCVIREFICANGKLSCGVNSTSKQDITFHIPGQATPAHVTVPAGKSRISLSP